MTTLRYVDPTRKRSRLTPLMAKLGTNRIANIISRRIGWRLDPFLLRLTGGRLASTLVIPTAVLQTRGARSGAQRSNAVIYFHDRPGRVIIAASHAGQPHNPSWYYNLLANPDVIIAGISARASTIDDADEEAHLWNLADQVFPAFRTYRARAGKTGRTIPLVALALTPDSG